MTHLLKPNTHKSLFEYYGSNVSSQTKQFFRMFEDAEKLICIIIFNIKHGMLS